MIELLNKVELQVLPFGENLKYHDGSEIRWQNFASIMVFNSPDLDHKLITIQYKLVTALMKVNTKDWLHLVPHHFKDKYFYFLPVSRQIYHTSTHECAITITLAYTFLLQKIQIIFYSIYKT